nr:helix-turn-helix transcriptional regulator [uncultured Desulfobulbus sp.]
MNDSLENCPCSGKSVSNLAAPWVLLTLHQNPSLHGYELTRIIREHIEASGMHINMTGLYRHLKALEQRGMLVSQWDTDAHGPARRTYMLTENGKTCLFHWMETLHTQARLINAFLNQAYRLFPERTPSTSPGLPMHCSCQ